MEAAPLDHALFYAGLGWQVFPVHSVVDVDQCSCGNAGCDHQGKHPITTNGLKAATDDEEQVREWWAQHPTANIGVATGEGSSLWVLDVDLRDDGPGHFAGFCDGREVLTVEQVTGSGGRHLVFAWDAEAGEVRNRTNVVPGVDVRGEGGYVIVPPSTHLSGSRYAWVEGRDPAVLEPQLAPHWLLSLALHDGPAAPAMARARGMNPAILTGPLPAREVRSIRSALGAISPDCDHETWFRVGMALHSTGAGEQAFAIWDGWSAGGTRPRGSGKGSVYPGTEAIRRRWRSFGRRENEVRISSLYYLAQQSGWRGNFEEATNGVVTAAPPPPQDASVAAAMNSMPAPGVSWPDPEWIWGRNEPPRFPIDDAFPERLWWLREWVKALSWTFQMPADFPASMAVAMACGAIGGKYCVSVPRVQWREPAAFWVVCAMPSGMGKSLAFDPLVKPFREYESGLREHELRAEWEARLRVSDLAVRAAEKELQRKAGPAASDPELATALEKRLTSAMLAREILMAQRPQSGRVLVSDATSEALSEFLEEHHGRALVADPEGGVFDHALGGASKAPRLDAWLKSYGGETIDERRIGNALNARSKGRYVKAPLVSVAVATQPRALGALFANELAGAKGFLARFLTIVVPPELPEEFAREGMLPSDLVDRWRSAVHRLMAGPRPAEPIEISLSEDARALFFAWGQGELDAARAGDSDDAEDYLSAWNAKFRGKALRLALVLHALSYESPGAIPVDGETMRATIAWLPYLQAHNDLVADVLRDDPDLLVAERVLTWIDARGLSGQPFSRGALFKGLKGGNTQAVRRVDDLNGPLATLTDAGWVRPVGRLEARRNGVPTSRRYEAHPGLGEHLARHRAAEAELGRTLGRRGL
jgi:hypothetical protein